MDKTEEQAFVRKLKRLDERAWEVFCSRFVAVLTDFVQVRFRCTLACSEEIVQQTLTRCVRSIHSFDAARGRLLAWLKAIATNEARTYLGKRNRAETPLSYIPQHILEQLAEAVDDAPLPEELLRRQDTRLLVRETLTDLNSRHRRLLLAKYGRDLRVAQIAAGEGTSDKAIESALTRARAAFREKLISKLAERRLRIAEILE